MSILLAVDPGIRGCGAALFSDKLLLKAAYVKNPVKKGTGPFAAREMATAVILWTKTWATLPDEYVCEWPQIYRAEHQKGDQNDLLGLAAVDTALAALLGHLPESKVTHFPVRTWKHQQTKQITKLWLFGNEFTEARLSKEEQSKIADNGAMVHNTYDAIGIGLYHLGRYEPKRVFVR